MQWGSVYGLAVEAREGITLAGVPLGAERPDLPNTVIERAGAADIEADWPRGGSVREREVRHPEGDLLLSVDRHDGSGYRVDAPHHGLFHVSSDGRAVVCAPREENPGGAQAVLLGQVLPLAATLRGAEVLHGGAVEVDGRTAVVCAPAGAGKSNLVARLVASGASLVADDAVAIEASGGVPVAHPGPGFVHLGPEDATRLPDNDRLTRIEGFRTRKVALAAPRSREGAELGVVYMLEPGDGALEISDDPAAGRSLLAATFVTVARTGERLRRHMDMAALVASSVAVRRLRVGGADRDEVALAVWDDLTAQ